MTTTTDSLPAADRLADGIVARQLTEEQALEECRLSGITLPDGEHWQYYLDAAQERARPVAPGSTAHVPGGMTPDGMPIY